MVFLRQGSRYIRAHVCRVQPEKGPLLNHDDVSATPSLTPQSASVSCDASNDNTVEDSESEDENVDQDDNAPSLPSSSSTADVQTDVPQLQATVPPLAASTSATIPVSRLERNQLVSFYPSSSSSEHLRCKAVIIGNAGKKSGPKKNWYNIEYLEPENMSGSKMSIDLTTVRDLSLVDSDAVNYVESDVECSSTDQEIFEIQHQTFDTAKQAELQSWFDNSFVT